MMISKSKMSIKMLVMDVDGTLTDGRIYVGTRGEMFKAFDVKDGYAIHNLLPDLEIIPVVITGRQSKLLGLRCAELGIDELYQGIADKVSCLRDVIKKCGLSFAEVAYIGDDLNDFPCMVDISNAGGLVGCPSDACSDVLRFASFVAKRPGGHGAVREFIDWIVANY